MKRRELDNIADKVRNWGRWGDDDQRGSLNLVTPEVLKRAARTVLDGKVFNLGLAFDADGPQAPGGRRFNPKLFVTEVATPLNKRFPSAVFSDDVIMMPSQAATQWDALGHAHYDGMLYNGCRACDILSEKGAARLGVEHLAAGGVVSRGVLLDIPRLKGLDLLPIDYAITPDDLDAACARQKAEIEGGDILVVRTGHMRRFTIDRDRAAFNGWQPGLDPTCAEWIYDKSIAAVAADNVAVEALTLESRRSEVPLPLHMLCLRDMGCPLGEMFDLEALAADCEADGRFAFLLSAPPLALTGAFGSPINPLVLK